MILPKYSDWYSQPESDFYSGSYGELFVPMDANVLLYQPDEILTAAATFADTRVMFVMLDGEGQVRVLHRLRRFSSFGAPGPQDGLNVAIMGEMSGLGPVFVEFPPNGFHPIDAIARVPTTAMTSELAAGSAAPQIPAETSDNLLPGEYSVTRSRHVMVVPPNWAGQVLAAASAPEGLRPRDLWANVVVPLLNDDDMRQQCGPFVDWSRIAYTQGAGAANPLHLPCPTPLALSPRLHQSRLNMLRQDFPGIHATGSGDQGMAPVVQILEGLRHDLHGRAEAAILREDEQRAASALPSKRWPRSVSKLLRLCMVDAETELPAVWLAMAKDGQKVDRQTIQFFLDDTEDQRLGQSGQADVQPICTTSVAKDLGQLRFIASPDDIDVGISIFVISHPDAETNARVSESVGLYDQQMHNVTNVSLTESIDLRKAQAFRLPTKYIELKHVCWCYLRFLATILGLDHVVTVNFSLFVERLQREESRFHLYFDADVERCAGLLRYIQIHMHEWARSTLANRDARVPPFERALDKIIEQSWKAPLLPAKYITAKKDKSAAAGSNKQGRASQSRGTKVEAPASHLDHRLIPYKADFRPAEFIAKHKNVPKNDQGGAMCLSYHVSGTCYDNCRRISDHRKHTEAEASRLLEYMASSSK